MMIKRSVRKKKESEWCNHIETLTMSLFYDEYPIELAIETIYLSCS